MLSSFIDPFLPENLDKQFVKRNNKKNCNEEEKIENDFEGLCNYISAPNIRHKVCLENRLNFFASIFHH